MDASVGINHYGDIFFWLDLLIAAQGDKLVVGNIACTGRVVGMKHMCLEPCPLV